MWLSSWSAIATGRFGLLDTKDPANDADSEESIFRAFQIFESALPKNHLFELNTLGEWRLYREDAMTDPTMPADVEVQIDGRRNSEVHPGAPGIRLGG